LSQLNNNDVKDPISNNNNILKDSNYISSTDIEIKNKEISKSCERLKKLISHRDNEISMFLLINGFYNYINVLFINIMILIIHIANKYIDILIGMVNEYRKKVGESNMSLDEIRAV